MFTMPHLTAWMIVMACSTWDVTTGATCQPHQAARRSGSNWWNTGLGARVTHPPPAGFDATAEVKPGVGNDDGVVFSLAIQTNTHGIENTFVNLTAADLILFLQCLIDPCSQVCDFPSNYNVFSLGDSRFTHTTYNFTCRLNTTMLRCMKSMDSDIEPFGVFKIIDPAIDVINATVYLSIDTTQTLTSVQWTDLRYIHFRCLYRDSGTETGDWLLVYNIIGAAMAIVVLLLLIITVWQSGRARTRHRKEMDSSKMVKVEFDEKQKESHIQSNLKTEKINTLPLGEYQNRGDNKSSSLSRLSSEVNSAFELNESQIITKL